MSLHDLDCDCKVCADLDRVSMVRPVPRSRPFWLALARRTAHYAGRWKSPMLVDLSIWLFWRAYQ